MKNPFRVLADMKNPFQMIAEWVADGVVTKPVNNEVNPAGGGGASNDSVKLSETLLTVTQGYSSATLPVGDVTLENIPNNNRYLTGYQNTMMTEALPAAMIYQYAIEHSAQTDTPAPGKDGQLRKSAELELTKKLLERHWAGENVTDYLEEQSSGLKVRTIEAVANDRLKTHAILFDATATRAVSVGVGVEGRG